jgi:hypothetical protein
MHPTDDDSPRTQHLKARLTALIDLAIRTGRCPGELPSPEVDKGNSWECPRFTCVLPCRETVRIQCWERWREAP